MLIQPHQNAARPVHLADPVSRSHPLNRGRLAWWLALPGLDGGRQWFDLMGFNHAALTGMGNTSNGWRPTTRPGGWGAILCDGSAGYAAAPRSLQEMAGAAGATDALSSLSFAAWCRPTGTAATGAAGYALPAMFGDSGGYVSLSRGIIGGQDRIWAYNYPGSETRVGGAYTADRWTRALWSHSGGTLTLYLDGVPAGTVASAATTSSVLISSLALGKQYTSTPFAGQLDDVTIWARGLSDADASADFELSRRGYPGVLNRPGGFPAALMPRPFGPIAATHFARRRRSG